jgi:hypothetical protein
MDLNRTDSVWFLQEELYLPSVNLYRFVSSSCHQIKCIDTPPILSRQPLRTAPSANAHVASASINRTFVPAFYLLERLQASYASDW